ncbi:MAG: hypothetical protein HYY93_00780 [Planctomycetes bacterium]|nr:hypothetical protein [Planctomycetota bacterium]
MFRPVSILSLLSLLLSGCVLQADHRRLEMCKDLGSAERAVVSPLMWPAGAAEYGREFTRAREPLSVARRVYLEPERRRAIHAIVDRLASHRLPSCDITLGPKPVYFDAAMTDAELAEADLALESYAGISVLGDTPQRRGVNWIQWRDRMNAQARRHPQPPPLPPAHRTDACPPANGPGVQVR